MRARLVIAGSFDSVVGAQQIDHVAFLGLGESNESNAASLKNF